MRTRDELRRHESVRVQTEITDGLRRERVGPSPIGGKEGRIRGKEKRLDLHANPAAGQCARALTGQTAQRTQTWPWSQSHQNANVSLWKWKLRARASCCACASRGAGPHARTATLCARQPVR